MSTCSKCGLAFGIGATCLCGFGAVVSGEAFELSRASDMACARHYELAPPLGCDEGPGSHNRLGWVNSVATASSTTVSGATFSGGLFVDAPTVAFTAHDAEDAAERAAVHDRMAMMVGHSVPFGSITFELVRPTWDERLALIRQSGKPVDKKHSG